ncbi:DUF3560 domain-containing protein [Micrococcaceae sp. AOP34-BR2-30]
MTLTITHTHAEGTLIEGTAKGDGTAAVLKAHRWRWGRSIAAWYIPHSRDKAAQVHRIEATASALQEAGFTVDVEIDYTARSTAEAEADKAARLAARAAALEQKAARKARDAEAAQKAAQEASERLPWGGEPVKVGHHSEARHRRALAAAHNSMGRSVEAARTAEAAAQRAAVAGTSTKARYNPATVARRIQRFEAEARKLARYLDGYTAQPGTPYAEDIPPATGPARERYRAEADRLADALEYWREVRDQQVKTGEAADYTRENINPGDFVKVSGSWWRVTRANPKTVTLESHGCSIRAEYSTLTDHRAAKEKQP